MAVHVVEKQIVDLRIATEKHSQEIMRRVQPLFENFIAEELSKFLDEFDNGSIIKIDRLELDLGRVSFENFDEEILVAFKQCLREHISEIRIHDFKSTSIPQNSIAQEAQVEGAVAMPQERYYIQVWSYFMQHGYFPASYSGTYELLQHQIIDLLKKYAEGGMSQNERIFDFSDSSQVQRFIAHANDDITYYAIHSWVKTVTAFSSIEQWLDLKGKILQYIANALERINLQTSQERVFRELMVYLFEHKEQLQQLVSSTDLLKEEPLNLFLKERNKALEVSDAPVLDTSKKEQVVKKAEVTTNELFLKNAGIVIIAPYLSRFFQNLELTEHNQFISKEHQDRAIKTLHYLATGGYACTEDELTLFKLLCALSLEEPVDINVTLPSHFYEEAEALLESVIAHWSMLKNSSTEALRETFFIRAGKLVHKEDHWMLFVENKGVDVLLDRIPWTFRTIRLPWMSKNLLIEWY